ncbi:hypothetical protein [Lactobacillus sp. ESL0225]|uniref:hypothetical protein n=1 Tax=Lactobacillus sp. ESL0225 TaxID=2069351 RepID=UPI001F4321F2|nr:hypothetical protein [Lactobacillus sp. ESL0225]
MKQFFNFLPMILFIFGLIFINIACFLINLIVGLVVTGLSLIVLAILIGSAEGGVTP